MSDLRRLRPCAEVQSGDLRGRQKGQRGTRIVLKGVAVVVATRDADKCNQCDSHGCPRRFIETPSFFPVTPAMPGPTCLRNREEPGAPACFGVEMPNLCCGFAATMLGSGDCRPALTPPLRATATLPRILRLGQPYIHYHLEGEKVNAHQDEREGRQVSQGKPSAAMEARTRFWRWD